MSIILPNFCRLPKKCKYTNNGCDFEKMPSEKQALDDHENDCQYRAFACPLISCFETVPLSSHSTHMDFHAGVVKNVPLSNDSFKGLITIWKETHPRFSVVTFTFEKKHFSLLIVRNSKGIYYIWLYVIG